MKVKSINISKKFSRTCPLKNVINWTADSIKMRCVTFRGHDMYPNIHCTTIILNLLPRTLNKVKIFLQHRLRSCFECRK